MLDLQEKDFGIVITKDIKDIYKKILNAKKIKKILEYGTTSHGME